ncbi:putative immunity protein [Variovorax boronicumulans]|uniref:putative immunity protein n=1 Tax=Variovorax boronicumulans TaxID=436515 RepID=UPI0033952546
MTDAVSSALQAHQSSATYQVLNLAFAFECVARVRHLLEDEGVLRCLDVLEAYLKGEADLQALEKAAAEAAALAIGHQGSRSLDGVGHAAVSASYAVANALAGRAVQAADYAAYAAVYGEGGYGAVSDPESFVAERNWQVAAIERLASTLAAR